MATATSGGSDAVETRIKETRIFWSVDEPRFFNPRFLNPRLYRWFLWRWFMTTVIFSFLIVVTAATHLWADYNGPHWLVYVTKPATTTLILALALIAPQQVSAFYQAAIVAGLLFSLAGDIFLMLPQDRFMAGLVSFLLAHLCYIAAFGSQVGWPPLSLWGLPVVVFAVGIYRLLLPHLGKLRLPVLVYMTVISLMAWLAITLFVQQGEAWTLWAAMGAILFVISDSTLALNRFRKPFWSAQLIVLGSYYVAQWLIAQSVWYNIASIK